MLASIRYRAFGTLRKGSLRQLRHGLSIQDIAAFHDKRREYSSNCREGVRRGTTFLRILWHVRHLWGDEEFEEYSGGKLMDQILKAEGCF